MEINSSITNFLDTKISHTFLWNVGKFIEVSKICGYDSVEWHLIPGVSGIQMKLGLVSQKAKDSISSLHQSTPPQETLIDAWRHPNRFLAMLHYFFYQKIKSHLIL